MVQQGVKDVYISFCSSFHGQLALSIFIHNSFYIEFTIHQENLLN